MATFDISEPLIQIQDLDYDRPYIELWGNTVYMRVPDELSINDNDNIVRETRKLSALERLGSLNEAKQRELELALDRLMDLTLLGLNEDVTKNEKWTANLKIRIYRKFNQAFSQAMSGIDTEALLAEMEDR